MLGLYVSDHPLLGLESALRRRCDTSIAELKEREDGAVVSVGGVVTSLQRKFTRRGEPMGVFVLEDLQESIEVTVFPRVMGDHGHKLADDAIVVVRGRLDGRDDVPKLLVQDITLVEGLTEAAPPLRLRLPATVLSEDRIGQLKRMLADHPGESPVLLDLGGGTVLRLPDDHRVDLGQIVGEVRVAFGHDAVSL
jgi:DNA polymerase-3 subunit alpha